MAVTFSRSDLDFILQQISYSEAHAAGADLNDLLPNVFVPWGLRTVTGEFNNLVPGQQFFGAADQPFPTLLDQVFRNEGDDIFLADVDGPGPGGLVPFVVNNNYALPGDVVDFDPRLISNLIVDQTITNPAAVQAFVDAGFGTLDANGVLLDLDGVPIPAGEPLFIPNTTPDEGLSAGFNTWFVFFGQFFDHGLDLVNKGGNGVIYMPLQEDDPLYVPGGATNFMVLTRATNIAVHAGDDGAFNTADDIHVHNNQTTPFVDQNQTYTSHPSHQVFLREYELVDVPGDGLGPIPVDTGRLLEGTAGGLATWADIKFQALTKLGIALDDLDVLNLPLLATDDYGNFTPGLNGFPKIVTLGGEVEGSILAPVDASLAIRTNHAFLDDIAHGASPVGDLDHDPNTPPTPLTADLDDVAGGLPPATGFYDDELLNAHFATGDGRGNENIGLTAVHHVFHSEHNRLVDQIKELVTTSADTTFMQQWVLPGSNVADGIQANEWDGQRLFQAARFGTEMEYQHLVFEEFARKVQPNVDAFLMYDATIDPAIMAEFAHVVYRFGHSMLTETVDRFDPDFSLIGGGAEQAPQDAEQIGLIAAFLNPLEFAQQGYTADQVAGAIVRGTTRQLGNEVDEFVTEALRNNLLGLPLDLPAINLARGRDTGVPSLNTARAEFYRGTSDSQLKPYISWVDFMNNLKHPESIINFIAAYGTHAAILAAGTLEDKREAATLLVLGDGDDTNGVIINGTQYTNRLDFLNATGTFAGGTLGGLNLVDLWIGGLAERQMPFGGLLGSTFNFVFETQLEALQNGDRFYYLGRLAGQNFLAELENNSFAKLIMANTDTTHLPADVFSTPGLILEVDRTKQFNADTGVFLPGPDGVLGDNPLTTNADESADDIDPDGIPDSGDELPGPDGVLGDNPLTTNADESLDDVMDTNADPTEGGTALRPLVIRNNPATPGTDNNYLEYTGDEHVVLGGTAGNDILIASIGDDTLWGDAGNDRLEGGDGVDNIEGGTGDDIITDLGGDDVLKGNEGNDVIHGGNGFNLIIGGAGQDFIITGEDFSDTFAGTGNDFIYGAKTNLPTLGGEGNDWIEIGTQDGAPGDNFDELAQDSVPGHDIFIGGGGFDEMLGEGGNDIFVGSEGEDHFDGDSGFDWVTFKNDTLGVTADMVVSDIIEPPVAPSNAGILDRYAFVEGLSGSALSDHLRGDDADAVDIAAGGTQGSVLTAAGIALIDGLQELLGAGVSTFASGNIILGGSGSDLIEGRGGDDLIDGDSWLNVRISIRNPATNEEWASADSMVGEVVRTDPLAPANITGPLHLLMLNGIVNPGQLQAVREILQGSEDFDTVVFSGDQLDYGVFINDDGSVTVVDNIVGRDGTDRLLNVERLQFNDGFRTLVEDVNANPVGAPVIVGFGPTVSPTEGQTLTVQTIPVLNGPDILVGVTDPDNPGAGAVTKPFQLVWQAEVEPGTGVFEDIVLEGGDKAVTASGTSFVVPDGLEDSRIRVKVIYQDANGVLETAFSLATGAVVDAPAVTPPAIPPEAPTESAGVHFIRSDLQFILDQIKIGERHAAGEDLTDILPNSRLALGIRTVDGSFNNLVPGQEHFGAADQPFPTLLDQAFRNENDDIFLADVDGPGPGGLVPFVVNNNYAAPGDVVDFDPRLISNLIVDQTISNPAAVQAFVDAGFGTLDPNGVLLDLDGVPIPAGEPLFIPNTAPDEGLSAGFNAWMTFFGQFFDHGLDLVNKGDNGVIYMPLQPDDPLYVPGGATNFMVLTRASNIAVHAGDDGLFNTADDIHVHNNQTTPFVDQNQTYTSHPSHQVFLREYELVDVPGDGLGPIPVDTGRLLEGAAGGLATWADIKFQALTKLGIALDDLDVLNLPLLATDPYGNFEPGPNGFPKIVTLGGEAEGSLALPVNASLAIRTNHAFLDDIAHGASPVGDLDHNPNTPPTPLTPDANGVAGGAPPATGFYDDELLNAHFATGDGRGNENIGLTAVHHVFHSEHNRLVAHIKDVVVASNDPAFMQEWVLGATPAARLAAVADGIQANEWDGQRLFQAARFGTEMQYQHLVFEEFARKIQPQVDIFFAPTQVYDTAINPAIVAEFAHVVYRFGHSMLTETVDRFDTDFSLIGGGLGQAPEDTAQIGLIAAFLNPLEFVQQGYTADQVAGAIVRGTTRQLGNEIDEFVTGALRNSLLGLPLDLPAINLARGRDTGVPALNVARAEFYEMTGDSQLKPYVSWVDFMNNLKHPESIINFIAAYGTHAAITGATTLAAKRAAATLLVLGDGDDTNGVIISGTQYTNRLDFLNATGTFAGGTLGGLNLVDLWIGGLAERKMPFGGFLGSTFNFVFETQMEMLQDGDRFYYLERTNGLNFLTELENNSFAKLIMANTDATHLPGDVFSTPGLILEVDRSKQFNPDTGVFLPGPDGVLGDNPLTTNADESADDIDPDGIPDSGDELPGPDGVLGDNPLTTNADESLDDVMDTNADPEGVVIRDNPNTAGADTNYLEYTGEDHVVLGGTNPGNAFNPSGNDILIASIGDDTVYGDDGNDRIEGGDGNDFLIGGRGDDIITDRGGDDNIQGLDGNDVIHAGNGINLVLGGFGNDFIITGEDASEAFGGVGDDFIMGNRANEAVFGNEGNDWLQFGMADGGAGDNFGTFADDAVNGHDIFYGDSLADRMDGEGGDDIMMGNGGQGDRYEGMSGFDWASFQHHDAGVAVDMRIRAFDETPQPLGSPGILTRYEAVEGLSGSDEGDVLQGDDHGAAEIAAAGIVGHGGAVGSILTNIALIDGLQEFLDNAFRAELSPAGPAILPDGVTSGVDTLGVEHIRTFGAGNIILGGGGSDIIIGDGGDDLIDGDMALNVYISVRSAADPNVEIDQALDMRELVPFMVSGQYKPSQLVVVRELENKGDDDDYDTARFSDILANYTIDIDDAGTADLGDDVVTVTHLVDDDGVLVLGPDGVDRLTNIERLQFADQAFILDDSNEGPEGLLAILDAGTNNPDDSPAENQLLRVSIANVTDGNNPGLGAITGEVSYFWQVEADPGTGSFDDIIIEDSEDTGGETVRATGETFRPGDAEAGLRLRVRAVYQDATGVLEEVFSAPTQAVTNLNDAPVGTVAISDTSPTESLTITAANLFTDADGLVDAVYSYQWQRLDGAIWVNVGADVPQFTPTQAEVGHQLRVIVSYTDDQGGPNSITSAPTGPVGDFIPANGAAQGLGGTAFDDLILGGGGADVINALGGSDTIDGGAQSDMIFAGADNDIINYTVGQGSDTVDGGAGTDRLNMLGVAGAGADLLDVVLTGTVISSVEGGSISNVEEFTANLGGGTNSLNYGTTTGPVTVNLTTGVATGFLSIANIQNVTGGAGDDLLTGNAAGNVLSGGNGNDTFFATMGDGNDTINGGNAGGIDTVDFSATDVGVTVTTAGAIGDATGVDVFTSIENIIGSQGNDTITFNGGANVLDGRGGDDTINAGAANDTLLGGAGNDTLNGEAGVDTLNGEAGDDTLTGGAANDIVNGGDGSDTVNYVIGNGADTVNDTGTIGTDTLSIVDNGVGNVLDVTWNGTILTNFEGGTIAGIESVTASMGGGVDRLSYVGSTGAVEVDLGAGTASGFSSISDIENVTGGTGADILTGGVGANNLVGGGGNDVYHVDVGDTVTEAAGGGTDTVFSSAASFTLGANVENLTIEGAGLNGIGNGLANIITGNGSANNLSGAGGSDTLTGGAANDTMDGGAGTDTFVFGPTFGNDVINNFDANATGGQDLLDISGLGITAATFAATVVITDLGTDTQITFNGTHAGNSILLTGVNGTAPNNITLTDFILLV